MRSFLVRLAALLVLAAGGAVGARALHEHYLPARATLPGLKIDGETVLAPGGADEVRALVAAHTRALVDRKFQLKIPVEGKASARVVAEATLKELGVSVDTEKVVALALATGHSGDLLEKVEIAQRAARGEVDIPLAPQVDAAAATPLLVRLKEAEDMQPVSARLDLEHRSVVPEKNGRYIDLNGALAAFEMTAVTASQDKALATIELPVASFTPRVSSAFVAKLDIATVISEYETYFSRAGDQSRRGRNIDVAASKLDGLVLSPGELMSFNGVVGDRSEENGFQKSWEIFKGEMVEGIGGGTCQVASTFHAVAFFAGLDVVERLPHSRPSAYIPMGLDSTVVYPVVDLKVKNPYPFPVVLHARTEGNKLKMQLLGTSRPARVSFGRELVSTVMYPRKIVEQPTLRGKKILVKQHGIRGFHIKRSRVLRFDDGTSRTEKNTDFYPPTTEIYEVPVGFDISLLPPLPDEDPDAEATPAAASATPVTPVTPASPTVPAVACVGDCAAQPQASTDLQMVDAPGAHAPTTNQANPAKTVWLKR